MACVRYLSSISRVGPGNETTRAASVAFCEVGRAYGRGEVDYQALDDAKDKCAWVWSAYSWEDS